MARVLSTSAAAPAAARQLRSFGGFALHRIALTAGMAALALWNVWTTQQLLALKERRIVSVSLQALVSDFVAVEARNGGASDATTARTKAYLAAVERAIKDMARDGTTVIVSEAVVGNSVPDVTPALKARLDRMLRAGGQDAGR